VIVAKRQDKTICVSSFGLNMLLQTPDKRINVVRNSNAICESPGERARNGGKEQLRIVVVLDKKWLKN